MITLICAILWLMSGYAGHRLHIKVWHDYFTRRWPMSNPMSGYPWGLSYVFIIVGPLNILIAALRMLMR